MPNQTKVATYKQTENTKSTIYHIWAISKRV